MKTKIILLVAIGFMTLNIQAQRVVALHSPTNGVQFFADDHPFQTAYAAAVDNDTIYLPGGSMLMPAVFEKKLTIYGAGHYPSATTATYPTKLSGDFTLSDEADGFYLEGVEITGSLIFQDNESINNVTIKRCKIDGSYGINIQGNRANPAENNVFIENIIHTLRITNLLNSQFFNNIIEGTVNEARNITFLNNDFIHNGSAYGYVIGYANGCMFKNNVFRKHYEDYRICQGAGTSTWSYNIFVSANPTLGSNPTTSNNYQVNPWTDIFVNVADVDNFDYNSDYHLQDPTTYVGEDATPVGIYGGYYPWKTESIPVNPHISSKNISNTSDSNGMIHIDMNVHAQDR